MPEPIRTERLCDAIIRAAAPLVPGDIRRDWMREWRAELAHRAARAHRAGRRLSPRSVWYAAGALPHAIWLRWDHWRIEMLRQDVKYALRSLLKNPGFTAVTVLTLAIGIGANAAIFGAVHAVLLRPLPYPQPERLVHVFKTSIKLPDRVGGSTSPPDFTDWRSTNTVFSEMAAISTGSFALTGNGSPEQVRGAQVTGTFFEVLGTPALVGRTLERQDDPMGGPDVVVLGHSVWTRRFGSDRSIVGRRVTIEGVSREVIGVMPETFGYPLLSEIWIPLRFSADDLTTQRGAHYLDVVARLKPGATLEAARAEIRGIAAQLGSAYPSTNKDWSAAVHPIRDFVVGNVRQSLFVLLGAVGLVLLIVCVNVASLVLIRAAGRGREMAVRLAVGAGRFALVRGLLVESLILGLVGGATGLVLAGWATTLIASLDATVGIPLLGQTRLDTPVVAFTFAVSVAAAIIFGTMPAWHATALGDVVQRIREEAGSTGGARRQRLRNVLVVAETTLAVILLVGAGLLTKSFSKLLQVDLGFDVSGVQSFSLTLPDTRYQTPPQRAAFLDSLLTKIASGPNVESAGAIFGLPLTNFGYVISVSIRDGLTLPDAEQDRLSVQVRVVTPDYFKTMGIRMTRGRPFDAADRLGAPTVAIVTEAAAKRLWPDQDPLGHQIGLGTRMGQGGERAGGTIVGVVTDGHDRGPALAPRPTLYIAHAQFPMDFMSVVVKVSRGEPSALIEPSRSALRDLDPDVPMFRVQTMEQIASTAVAQPRLNTILMGAFAGSAMLLAAIGLYGVLAYAVGQRTREIGIRLALGANRGEVLRMVMRQAGGLTLAGVAGGLGAAALVTRALESQLFEVASTDGSTYALVAVGLMLVSLVASWVPARRAAKTDPITALRHD